MRTLSTALCSLVAAGLLSAYPTHLHAQSSQGGLRGVVKDCAGRHSRRDRDDGQRGERRLARHGHQRRRRVLLPRDRTRHLHRQGVGAGLQDVRAQGGAGQRAAVPRSRHHARNRRARGDDHRHRRVAADRHHQRVHRRRPRHAIARVDSERRPQRVPDGEPDADGADQRQRALEPHAGSGRQLRDVDGRRRGARQQLPGRRLPGHRPAEPRLDQPDHRSRAGRQGAGAHLRRRDGTHRRRRDEHGGEVRRQRLPRLGLHRVPSRVAGRPAADPEAAGPAERARILAQRRRRRRRPDRQEQDVLLVRRRGVRRQPAAADHGPRADGGGTDRQLQRRDPQRRAGQHQGSAHRRQLPRQRHSGEPPESGRRSSWPATCRRRTRRSTTATRTSG